MLLNAYFSKYNSKLLRYRNFQFSTNYSFTFSGISLVLFLVTVYESPCIVYSHFTLVFVTTDISTLKKADIFNSSKFFNVMSIPRIEALLRYYHHMWRNVTYSRPCASEDGRQVFLFVLESNYNGYNMWMLEFGVHVTDIGYFRADEG